MKEYLAVVVGGGAGAALRYWLSGSVYRVTGAGFPYGTLLVNAVGCFVIGLLMALFEERFVVQPLLKVFLTIGILGGFTTFSTFSFETYSLFREGSLGPGLLNVALSLLFCLGGTWGGNIIGRLF